jgi:hypothetical protein
LRTDTSSRRETAKNTGNSTKSWGLISVKDAINIMPEKRESKSLMDLEMKDRLTEEKIEQIIQDMKHKGSKWAKKMI